MPSHYLKWWWHMVNWILWNKFQWKSNQNIKFLFGGNAFGYVICKCHPFCSGLNGLNINIIQSNPYMTFLTFSQNTPNTIDVVGILCIFFISFFYELLFCILCLCLDALLYGAFYYLNQRADSRFAPSQWEMALLCNDVSHWLGTNLESAQDHVIMCTPTVFHISPSPWMYTVMHTLC